MIMSYRSETKIFITFEISAIGTQILSEFLIRHYLVSIDKNSLKSEGGVTVSPIYGIRFFPLE